ncbi:uncharacterized protein LOC113309821 [Papaver somniferum]|uniref:uncharacterized protein LOC113309821 n=1 Tax=Papaver somniferum TaxID=3469 RepID=UPI000E6FDD4C|nr:uncharacterized protein LOC113309821 [Papaver somniferum]
MVDECLDIIFPNKELKVADFMVDGILTFPYCNHLPHCDDCHNILQGVDYNIRDEDKVIWKGSKKGDFSMKETFQALTGDIIEVGWTKLVWFKNNIPINSFICWLTCHRRLKTKAKLQRWGLVNNASCVLCGGGTEDEDHLFLSCSFSSLIWKGLLIKMGIFRDVAKNWDEELLWCHNNFKNQGAVNNIKKLCLNNFVYHVWMKRNNRIFSTKKTSPEGVSHLITLDIRLECLAIKISNIDKPYIRRFMENWGIDCL